MSLAYLKLPLLFRYYHVLPKCRHHSTLVLFCISAFDRNIQKKIGSGSATLLCLTEIYYFGVFPNFFPKWIRIRMCGNECGFGSTALIYSFGLIFISLYLFFNSRIIHFRSGSEAAEPVPVPVSAGAGSAVQPQPLALPGECHHRHLQAGRLSGLPRLLHSRTRQNMQLNKPITSVFL